MFAGSPYPAPRRPQRRNQWIFDLIMFTIAINQILDLIGRLGGFPGM